MQLREKCLCLTAVLLVILVSVSSARPYDEQQEEEQQQQEQNGNVRDKRTLNFLLKSFADAIGYDVQKRPSALPFGVQFAPVGLVNIIPPIGPVTPVKAPAAMGPVAPAMGPVAPAMVPAPAAMVPAAPAMVPAPAAMAPAKPAMPPPASMAPAPAGMAPAPAGMAPAQPAMAPAPAAMAPAAPAVPPAAPAAGKATPAAPAMAPAMPPAGAMPPAAPAMPLAAPAAPAMPPASPAAPAGKAAPLLMETIRKVFNLNFNWNRNLQPQISGVAPNASAAPAPQMPVAGGAPAPQLPAGGAPASQLPAAPAPQMPAAPAPQMPAAPAAGQAISVPAVPNIVPLAVPAAKDPLPAPMAPAMVPVPDLTPAAAPAPVPAAPEMAPAAPEMAPALPALAPAVPAPASPAPLYYQPIQNVQLQPNAYQELQNINQPPIYYPTEQAALNEANSNENLQKDYSLPEAVQLFWQHSPWNQPNLPHVQNAVPEYREYSTPDGERGYHVRRVQQNAHLQHQDLQPEDNDAEEEENNARERQEERSSEENDDANGDSSKAFVTINNQPRGFQPAYAESRNQYQNGGFYQPGLPLAVHGVHEDKVLVAWPSPFELAGSEKKLKKVDPHERISGAASENLEYRYQPENYDQFNFYTIPPPTKNQYENYETPSDPNIEDTLSANARIHENNYGKKYTTVHIDRQTYHH